MAVVAALVLGGATVTSAHVTVSTGAVNDPGTILYDTAVTGFSYTNRSINDAPLNTSINVTFVDADMSSPHTFTLFNFSNFWIQNWSTSSSAELDSVLHAHGSLVNITAPSGGKAYETFTSPRAAGYYEFVCLEPGHFQSGMWGIIAFGEDVPANISFGGASDGPGLAVFIIIGTIVTLTVLAIVLGFVVGRRQGSEHEMPPERLGYAEPPASGPLPPSPPRPPGPS